MLAEGTTSTTGAVLLVAGAIVLVISLGRLARKRRRDVGSPDADGDADSVRRIREAGDREIVRIEEHARDASARIETKLHVLNGLTLRAERAIARLGEQASPGSRPGVSAQREAVLDETRFSEVYRLADEGLDPAEIASRTEFEAGEIELVLTLRSKSADPGQEGAGGVASQPGGAEGEA